MQDNYKPWRCSAGHKLSIKQVTWDGLCVSCSSPVSFDSNKQEVQQAILEDDCKPMTKIFFQGKYVSLLEKECLYCFETYETIHTNKKYCSNQCRTQSMQEESPDFIRPGYINCMFCGKEVETPDKRKRFCSKECREDNKRLKVKVDE